MLFSRTFHDPDVHFCRFYGFGVLPVANILPPNSAQRAPNGWYVHAHCYRHGADESVVGCQDVDAVLGRFGWGFLVPFRLFPIVWV